MKKEKKKGVRERKVIGQLGRARSLGLRNRSARWRKKIEDRKSKSQIRERKGREERGERKESARSNLSSAWIRASLRHETGAPTAKRAALSSVFVSEMR